MKVPCFQPLNLRVECLRFNLNLTFELNLRSFTFNLNGTSLSKPSLRHYVEAVFARFLPRPRAGLEEIDVSAAVRVVEAETRQMVIDLRAEQILEADKTNKK